MKTLYKFIFSQDAVGNIIDGKIKFTRVSELNDPNELFAHANPQKVAESLAYYRDKGYNETDLEYLKEQENLLRTLTPNLPILPAPKNIEEANRILQLPHYENVELLISVMKQVREEMLNNTGVLSLSKRYDSFPMWAHYANNAQGFVVEFENLANVFNGNEIAMLNKITEVDYNDIPHITFAPDSHRKTFFTKHHDWSYEREVRVIKPLSECEQRVIKPLSECEQTENIFLSQIPKNLIKRVIIGWKCPMETEKSLCENIKAKNPNIIISKATIQSGIIELENL